MKIIKRSGVEVFFDSNKIVAAVQKANASVIDYEKLSDEQIQEIADNVEVACENMKRSASVEEIQDMVETQLMNQHAFTVARNYITYRYKRALVRKSNSTDEQILSLLECNNEEVKQENSNKNPTVNSVQRDYMAGEVSKDITKRFLLPEDIVEAHEKGLIDKVLTTNLVYKPEDVLTRDYYVSVDMSKYIALLIDTLNHDQSISELLNPTERIQNILKKYGQR